MNAPAYFKASLRFTADTGYGSLPPLQHFLQCCHREFSTDHSGEVANYIPELQKADGDHFGISIATVDGHVYEVGDSHVPFTIQSVSKAYVFALALELLGHELVERVIGVEPSGEAFNSIRLTADNRPFNPMVNAGAIACSGLIESTRGAAAFESIRAALSRFAGRELDVDEDVYRSECDTGDRNRAIGWLLKNHSVISGNVDKTLDAYFRQCAIRVTARDLAVMAATLANRGVNPITGERVIKPFVVARTLSVMTSSGMYDYAGQWTYRIGIPAKSGVGGGISAALPSQIGVGTFSPRLDQYGNSVRGLRVFEKISSEFDLHILNRSADVKTCIIADYDIFATASRRSRPPAEQALLDLHCKSVRVLELVGALNFANVDYVGRRLARQGANAPLLVLDLRRVPDITIAAARLMAESLRGLAEQGVTTVLSGQEAMSPVWKVLEPYVAEFVNAQHRFELLDEAIEWTEDQVIFRHGGFVELRDPVNLGEQALLAGLADDAIDELMSLAVPQSFQSGQRIVAAGERAASVYFLMSGLVSVKLPSGVRLASLSAGTEFGEMAIIERVRSADVWADTAVTCLELSLVDFAAFRSARPEIGHLIMRNLASLLSRRLILANAKVDLLSAY
jgi:glutaminase